MTLSEQIAQERLLADGIGKIVQKYFSNREYGSEKAVVRYVDWGIKKWEFEYVSQTFNRGVRMCFSGGYDKSITDFKKEVRKFLKENGFAKVKFDTKKITYRGTPWGDEPTTQLVGIYFDK